MGPPVVPRIYHGKPLGPLGEVRIVSGCTQVPLEVYFARRFNPRNVPA